MFRKMFSKDKELVSSTRRKAILRLIAISTKLLWMVSIIWRHIFGLYIFWISFSQFSSKLLMDWYQDIYTCRQFITEVRKEMEAKQGRGWPCHRKWREKRNWMDNSSEILVLDIGFWLELADTVFVSSMRHSLISLFKLDKVGIYLCWRQNWSTILL